MKYKNTIKLFGWEIKTPRRVWLNYKVRRTNKKIQEEVRIGNHIASIVVKELYKSLLADIGVEQLKKIVEQSKKNSKDIGHNDYTKLGEMLYKLIHNRRK